MIDDRYRICSIHQEVDPNCEICKVDIRDVLPDYEKKHADAVAAGLHTCVKCGFEFYKTIDICPLCSTKWKKD